MGDARHMAHALGLAARGLGQVWPNPAVGCVLVRDNRVIGRGWTQPSGRPHAEAMALNQAGPTARGATVYVTLEPCSHHGKTPPCADALIAAGVARVVTPLIDPDPQVSGAGLERLRAAGVQVEIDVTHAERAHQLNAGFLMHRQHGRPLVTLKLASSLDARIATATGESRWITSPAARRRVHLMRAQADAVLVGAGTARADDPRLDIRGLGLARHAPVRVIADSTISLPLSSQLAKTVPNQPVWLVHRQDAAPERCAAWGALGAKLIACDTDAKDRLDPVALLKALGARGITRVFCEGGGQLAASLLRAYCVDRLVEMRAGLALGAEGLPAIADLGLTSLADAPRFELDNMAPVGPDAVLEWRRVDDAYRQNGPNLSVAP